ncbi:hypothetical protein DFH29DRAFT_1073810 [Suillus ampliporus]|nr:hypothetical protein DFH29DRAFT_1073810 [Suillus ampliporus]
MYSRHANELVINLLDVTTSLITAVTYGHTSREKRDSFLARANELNDIGQHIISPDLYVPMVIAVEKLPTWCFRGAFALMGRSRELSRQLLNEPFNEVKAQVASGTASRSLVTDFLSQADDSADEDTMKAVALTGYVAGTDTTTSVLQTFLLAMVLAYKYIHERIVLLSIQ